MAQRRASAETGWPGVGYCRHRPEDTLLYQVVEHYYPLFAALRAEQGRALPAFVQREFEEYLKCGRLEHGFLRVRCSECHAEKLVAFSCKRRGFAPAAVHAAWSIVLRCWSTTCCRTCPYGSRLWPPGACQSRVREIFVIR